MKYVQSCITNVGFPTTVDAYMAMYRKNIGVGIPTDMDLVLSGKPEDWTAPKWLSTGDILFFYHAVMAKKRIRKVRRELYLERPETRPYHIALDRAEELADRYGGTLFGCSVVTSPPEFEEGKTNFHFKSKVFAPLGETHIFENPLPLSEMERFVKIARQATITPLCGPAFDDVVAAIGNSNTLPEFITNVKSAEIGFRDVTKENWKRISCESKQRFIHETQLREFLIDFLLEEIKDDRTELLEECACVKDEGKTGIADYFIMIGGRWIPVEAKLNVISERDILGQVDQYLGIRSARATHGRFKGKEVRPENPSICLVVDQEGVYIASQNGFQECGPGRPKWRREELPQQMDAIRETLLGLIN